MASIGRQYVFGPVFSRRLRHSLGIDLVPGSGSAGPRDRAGIYKFCTLDCMYCQLGATGTKIVRRRRFVDAGKVLAELTDVLKRGVKADYISFSGSGEPTLHSDLGRIIRGVKRLTDIPVAVITNGTLFYRNKVREDCLAADLVLPSLDAGDQRTFQRINRPHLALSLEKLVSGLSKFRQDYTGQIWLEVFLIDRVNTSDRQIKAIKAMIEKIRPDKVQLNTAARPAADGGRVAVPAPETIRRVAAILGSGCEIIKDLPSGPSSTRRQVDPLETLLSMLKRRPCSMKEICLALGVGSDQSQRYLRSLREKGLINSDRKGGDVFYSVPG